MNFKQTIWRVWFGWFKLQRPKSRFAEVETEEPSAEVRRMILKKLAARLNKRVATST